MRRYVFIIRGCVYYEGVCVYYEGYNEGGGGVGCEGYLL